MAAFRGSQMRLWSGDTSSGQVTLALGEKDEKIIFHPTGVISQQDLRVNNPLKKIVSAKQPLTEDHQENRCEAQGGCLGLFLSVPKKVFQEECICFP